MRKELKFFVTKIEMYLYLTFSFIHMMTHWFLNWNQCWCLHLQFKWNSKMHFVCWNCKKWYTKDLIQEMQAIHDNLVTKLEPSWKWYMTWPERHFLKQKPGFDKKLSVYWLFDKCWQNAGVIILTRYMDLCMHLAPGTDPPLYMECFGSIFNVCKLAPSTALMWWYLLHTLCM